MLFECVNSEKGFLIVFFAFPLLQSESINSIKYSYVTDPITSYC